MTGRRIQRAESMSDPRLSTSRAAAPTAVDGVSGVAGLMVTLAPLTRRSWPSTTTCSPASRPLPITDSPLWVRLIDDRAQLGDAVLDDEQVGPLRSELDGRRGHRDRFGLDAEDDLDLDELAGPQAFVGIADARLGGHRAGQRIDIVLEEGDGARLLAVVVDEGNDLDVALGHRRADIGQEDLRHGEGDVDRIDLVDGGERARRAVVADADHGAGLARDRADAARHGRADLGVGELGHARSPWRPRRPRAGPRRP